MATAVGASAAAMGASVGTTWPVCRRFYVAQTNLPPGGQLRVSGKPCSPRFRVPLLQASEAEETRQERGCGEASLWGRGGVMSGGGGREKGGWTNSFVGACVRRGRHRWETTAVWDSH